MILRFFKNSQPVSFIIIFVLSIGFWAAGWLNNSSLIIVNPMPLYHLLLWVISPLPLWFAGFLGLILVNLQMFHLNKIVAKHEILYKSSHLPALFYLFLTAIIPAFTSFHPVIVVNTIMLFALDKIFRIYKNTSPQPLIFDACFLIAASSLFYLPTALFFVFFIIGLIILKSTNIKDWLIGFTGFLAPYLFVFTWYFLTDSLDELKAKYTFTLLTGFINLNGLILSGQIFTVSMLVLLTVLSLLKFRANYYKNIIRSRRFHQVLFVYMVVGFASLALTQSEEPSRFIILVIPFAVLFSYYFLTIKKLWWSELLFWVLSSIIIFNYVYPIIL
jgi:uncharacterized protein DUF6427